MSLPKSGAVRPGDDLRPDVGSGGELGISQACRMRAMTLGQLRSLAVTQIRHKRPLTWEHRGQARA